MKKAILFLGVGHLQKYSIISAKKLGFTIFGVDVDKKAKSLNYCDYFLNSDATDAVSIHNWCKSINDCKIEAVWANNDILIPTRVSLEVSLGVKVPYANHEACFDLLSKVRSLEILKSTGFVPKQFSFKKTQKSSFTFPLIVKPKKGSGSIGVKLITSEAELYRYNFNPEKEVIEEYLLGNEFGTNHFYDGSSIFKLPAVRRYFDHKFTMVPLGTVLADMDDLVLQDAYTGIERAIISNNWVGPTKADIFINNQKFNIIEMSPRFHGEIDTAFVFNYFNLSLPDMYFSSIENTEKNSWKCKVPKNKPAAGYISICNQNIIDDINFIESTLEKYGLNFLSFVSSGSKTKNEFRSFPKSTSDLIGFVFYSTKHRLDDRAFSRLFKEINLLNIENKQNNERKI
jgi:predicted ATP-grasp superfamily ATP-dependent carboligase